MRQRIFCVAACLLISQTAQAKDGAETLAWRFETGQALGVKLNQNLNTTVKVLGNDLKTVIDSTLRFTWKVTDVDASGNADVVVTLDRVQIKMDSPQFGKGEVDSQESKQLSGLSAQLASLYKPLLGVEMTQKISAQGKVTDLVIPEDVANELKKAALPGIPGATATIAALNSTLPEFPAEPLGPDKSWKSESTVESAPGISAVMNNTYTYRGIRQVKSRNLHKIDLNIDLKMETDGGPEIEVVEQSTDGTMYFDSEAGRLVGTNTKQNAEIKIKISGQEVTQTLTSSTKLLFSGLK